MTDPVLHHGQIVVDQLPPRFDLVAAVRAHHDAGVAIGWMWDLVAHPRADVDEHPALTVGVNNGIGILEWNDGQKSHVPATGTHPDWSEYWIAGLHPGDVPPNAHVPLDTAYAAIAEFVVTRTRPTCVA
ncbi:Imm1 family immunity protein [Actinokineospora diospyrosa]|uniref:Immunity protein Imm1 n=1 Tax=Actinokineospora diospyrosa TaxID=103728 RepID=A0ABT1I5Q3_9PSEU|nr:Imm1 family immunity protein [Actinokineospora diospyrosa]MCP2267736.1 Immunity protein Imm1 [Actinokineospora diospyrosa]